MQSVQKVLAIAAAKDGSMGTDMLREMKAITPNGQSCPMTKAGLLNLQEAHSASESHKMLHTAQQRLKAFTNTILIVGQLATTLTMLIYSMILQTSINLMKSKPLKPDASGL